MKKQILKRSVILDICVTLLGLIFLMVTSKSDLLEAKEHEVEQLDLSNSNRTVKSNLNFQSFKSKKYLIGEPTEQSCLWSPSGSDIYYSGGKVGIGTSSPNADLHIFGGYQTQLRVESWYSGGNPSIYINAITPAGNASLILDRADTGGVCDVLLRSNGTSKWCLSLPDYTSGDSERLDLMNSLNDPVITFKQNENIGIGVTNPNNKLHIYDGNLNIEAIGNTTKGLLLCNGIYGFIDYHTNSGFGIRFSGYGPLLFGHNSNVTYGSSTFTEFMRINSIGYVGIGTANPTQRLHVNGYIYSWGCVSDIRLKKDIETLDGSLSHIQKLRGIRFKWDQNVRKNPQKGYSIGLIAQELEKVYPELIIRSDSEGYLGIDYEKMSAILLEALKELKREKDREISELRTEIEKLESLVVKR